MNLSKRQKEVINYLKNGYQIMTDSSEKGAWIGSKTWQFHINNGIFWRMVNKGLISQSSRWPFNYELTELGKTIIT